MRAMSNNKILVTGPTIALSPLLARAAGLEEAIVLQQLNYRLYCASSDVGGRWIYVIHEGRGFVGWSSRGRKDDLLLDEYPFKRVLKSLRSQKLVIEGQGLDNKWDRRIFLSIDHGRVASMCGDQPPSSDACTLMDRRDRQPSINSEHQLSQDRKEQREERGEDDSRAADYLLNRVEAFVGNGPNDDRARDERCLNRIKDMVLRRQIFDYDLIPVLYDKGLKHISQIEKSLVQIIKGKEANDAKVARAIAVESTRERERLAELRDMNLRNAGYSFLVCCTDETLDAISNHILSFNAASSLTARATAAVRKRSIGSPPARALVMRALIDHRYIKQPENEPHGI